MAMNEIRQQARKSAAERVARLRQQRADLVKKQEELSATVMTALAERDAVIADAERRAGAAPEELASSGLSLAQAAQWCDLVDKEAARLVKLAAQPTTSEGGHGEGKPLVVTGSFRSIGRSGRTIMTTSTDYPFRSGQLSRASVLMKLPRVLIAAAVWLLVIEALPGPAAWGALAIVVVGTVAAVVAEPVIVLP